MYVNGKWPDGTGGYIPGVMYICPSTYKVGVYYNDVMNVYNGGVAEGSIVRNCDERTGACARMNVYNNAVLSFDPGIAISTTLEMGGEQHVYDGGVASSTIIGRDSGEEYLGGKQYVFLSGSAYDTTLRRGSEQHVYDGGSAFNTTLETAISEQYVYDNGYASKTTIQKGTQKIWNGGKVYDTTVLGNGMQDVQAGGQAYDTIISGTDIIALQVVAGEDSYAYRTTIRGGNNARQTVSDGGYAAYTSLYASSGELRQVVRGGGMVFDTTLNPGYIYDSGARTYVLTGSSIQILGNDKAGGSSAMAISTFINGECEQQILHGGSAYDTVISSLAQQSLNAPTAYASGTIIHGGRQLVSGGGSAYVTTVHSDGTQQVVGATAEATTLSGGKVLVQQRGRMLGSLVGHGTVEADRDSVLMVDGGTSGGMSLLAGSGGTLTVSAAGGMHVSGASATNLTLALGTQNVSRGGVASSTILNRGTSQYIYNEAAASATTVHTEALQVVANGGAATNTTLEGGRLILNPGGTLRGTVAGYGHVSAGSAAGGPGICIGSSCPPPVSGEATVLVDGGTSGLAALSGTALFTDATLNVSGNVNVQGGGSATHLTMVSGTQTVDNGGTADGTVLHDGVTQVVNNGGSALKTFVRAGATQVVNNGGSMSGTNLEGGTLEVKNGGAVNGALLGYGVVDAQATLRVDNGASGLTRLHADGGTLTVKGDVEVQGIVGGTPLVTAARDATLNIQNTLRSVGTLRADLESYGTAQVAKAEGGEFALWGTGTFLIGQFDGSQLSVVDNTNASVQTLGSGVTSVHFADNNQSGVMIVGGGEATPADFARVRAQIPDGRNAIALRGTSADKAVIRSNTLVVEKASAVGGVWSDWSYYVFGRDALSTTGTAALTLKDWSGLGVVADRVSFDFSGASLRLGDSITLMASTKGRINLNGNGTARAQKLDDEPDGLVESAYNLFVEAGNKLKAAFNELNLYGKGGDPAENTAGQRETGNTLTIDSDLQATAAFGGRAVSGKVSRNTVEMSKGELVQTTGNDLSGHLYGGYADDGDATENTVVYSGGTVPGAIYGGFSKTGGTATDNTVALKANFNGKVYGGNTGAGNNTLAVQGSGLEVGSVHNFEKYSFAANALSATPGDMALTVTNQGGVLNIDASKVKLDTTNGGLSLKFGETAGLMTVQNGTLNASNSGVAITGKLDDDADGLIDSVYNLTANGNALSATFNELYSYGQGGTQNTSGQREKDNTLTFTNGIATAAFGGRAKNGDVIGNTANMSGGTLEKLNDPANPRNDLSGNLYGGYADNGNATKNTVVYSGGTVQGSIYGGYANGGTATGNTVALKTSFGGKVYGGNNAATGNTLSVENKGLTVDSIDNFENLHFILPSDTAAGETMLEVTGGATQFKSKPNVGVAIAGSTTLLNEGDSVTLLRNDSGLRNSSGAALTDTDYAQVKIPARQGISVDYDFTLSTDGKTIVAEVSQQLNPGPTPGPTPDPSPSPSPEPSPSPAPTPSPSPTPGRINPQTKAIPEGRIAALGALNLASDQVARIIGNLPQGTGGAGGGNGAGNAPDMQTPGDGAFFAKIAGYGQKLESGSHVNVNGTAAIVGTAKAVPLSGGGTAAVGAFFEYGDGSFKTHNGFDTGAVDGKGNSDYYGAGVLARVNLAGNGNGAPFVEGSLHAGSIRNNWHTDDLRDAATGARAQYDIRTPYMGAHVGAGYRWQTNDTTQVEAYGQYLYTHVDGKDTNVALDPYHFGAVKSSRTRVGAKGAWAVSQQAQAYAGAAWEHEFDGTARATAYSLEVPAPTMKGDTAVIDAGVTFQPKRNLSTNVGVTGYAGKRKGVAANVEVQYRF